MINTIKIIIFVVTLLALLILIIILVHLRKSLQQLIIEQNKPGENTVLPEYDILKQRKNIGVFIIIFLVIFIILLVAFIKIL